MTYKQFLIRFIHKHNLDKKPCVKIAWNHYNYGNLDECKNNIYMTRHFIDRCCGWASSKEGRFFWEELHIAILMEMFDCGLVDKNYVIKDCSLCSGYLNEGRNANKKYFKDFVNWLNTLIMEDSGLKLDEYGRVVRCEGKL